MLLLLLLLPLLFVEEPLQLYLVEVAVSAVAAVDAGVDDARVEAPRVFGTSVAAAVAVAAVAKRDPADCWEVEDREEDQRGASRVCHQTS